MSGSECLDVFTLMQPSPTGCRSGGTRLHTRHRVREFQLPPPPAVVPLLSVGRSDRCVLIVDRIQGVLKLECKTNRTLPLTTLPRKPGLHLGCDGRPDPAAGRQSP